MNNDTALILLIADLQRTIEAQRAEIQRLSAELQEAALASAPPTTA